MRMTLVQPFPARLFRQFVSFGKLFSNGKGVSATMGSAIVLICMGLFLDCTRPTLALLLTMLFGAFFAGNTIPLI
jgi:hypothetical protein